MLLEVSSESRNAWAFDVEQVEHTDKKGKQDRSRGGKVGSQEKKKKGPFNANQANKEAPEEALTELSVTEAENASVRAVDDGGDNVAQHRRRHVALLSRQSAITRNTGMK